MKNINLPPDPESKEQIRQAGIEMLRASINHAQFMDLAKELCVLRVKVQKERNVHARTSPDPTTPNLEGMHLIPDAAEGALGTLFRDMSLSSDPLMVSSTIRLLFQSNDFESFGRLYGVLKSGNLESCKLIFGNMIENIEAGIGMRPEAQLAVGTVKFFDMNKGHGLIAPDNGNKDVFVHISAVNRSGMSGLSDGQKVIFDLERDKQGRESATNLKAV